MRSGPAGGLCREMARRLVTQLVTANNDYDQTKQLLAKAQKLSDLVTLTAPEDAVVLKIANASIGSVAEARSRS